jgi:NAD(P)-dependent dehydrogenase (short-subunit alcohol dehydrogenase family)
MPNIFDLSGRVTLVTGGNSGVGLGLAEGLAQAGAVVCIWGTNETKNTAALEHLSKYSSSVSAMRVDISDEEQVRDSISRLVSEQGHLDACFANAGISGMFGNPDFVDSDMGEWQRMMGVNIAGTYVTLREAARQMIAQGDGGSLVATASLAGAVFGAPRDEAYAVTKAGIVGLTRSLAVALGKHRIRVNALLPGWTMSPQFEPWTRNPGVSERIMSRIPLRRFGEPSDWAAIAVYLASPASSFHTGDQFRIDGGYGVF